MIGIGINLDDLGIETDPDYESSYSQWDTEDLEEYDFALALLVYGSWRKLREALRPVAEDAYAGDHRETPLWFTLYWVGQDGGDTETSIEKALTGVRYDGLVHDAFTTHLYDWVGNTEDLNEFLQVARTAAGTDHEWIRYEPLRNSWLDSQEVRAIYDMVKDDRRGPRALMKSKSPLPADIVDWLAKREDTDGYAHYELLVHHTMTEQNLMDLTGKCDAEAILMSQGCTDRVRNEIEKVWASGGALTVKDRECAAKGLKYVQSAIRSGRTGGIERRRGDELRLLDEVRANPEIGLGEVSKILRVISGEIPKSQQWRRTRKPAPVTRTRGNKPSPPADDDF